MRPPAQDAFDFFHFAAHDRRVDAVARDLGVLLEDAQRGVTRDAVRRASADVVVRTGIIQKSGDELSVRVNYLR